MYDTNALCTRLEQLLQALKMSTNIEIESIRRKILEGVIEELERIVQELKAYGTEFEHAEERITDHRIAWLLKARERGIELYAADGCRMLLEPQSKRIFFDRCWESDHTIATIYMYADELMKILNYFPDKYSYTEDIAEQALADLARRENLRASIKRILRNERIRRMLTKIIADQGLRREVVKKLRQVGAG